MSDILTTAAILRRAASLATHADRLAVRAHDPVTRDQIAALGLAARDAIAEATQTPEDLGLLSAIDAALTGHAARLAELQDVVDSAGVKAMPRDRA